MLKNVFDFGWFLNNFFSSILFDSVLLTGFFSFAIVNFSGRALLGMLIYECREPILSDPF